MSGDYWTRFWQDKDDPLHPVDDDAFYDLMAGELLLLLGSRRRGTVLELGCDMYERLGFDEARYIGVDISPTMLAAFSEAHPGTRLEVADARGYVPTEPLDLIISGLRRAAVRVLFQARAQPRQRVRQASDLLPHVVQVVVARHRCPVLVGSIVLEGRGVAA